MTTQITLKKIPVPNIPQRTVIEKVKRYYIIMEAFYWRCMEGLGSYKLKIQTLKNMPSKDLVEKVSPLRKLYYEKTTLERKTRRLGIKLRRIALIDWPEKTTELENYKDQISKSMNKIREMLLLIETKIEHERREIMKLMRREELETLREIERMFEEEVYQLSPILIPQSDLKLLKELKKEITTYFTMFRKEAEQQVKNGHEEPRLLEDIDHYLFEKFIALNKEFEQVVKLIKESPNNKKKISPKEFEYNLEAMLEKIPTIGTEYQMKSILIHIKNTIDGFIGKNIYFKGLYITCNMFLIDEIESLLTGIPVDVEESHEKARRNAYALLENIKNQWYLLGPA